MKANTNSTARGVAMMRAAHLLLDAEPIILRDVLAQAFAGYSSEEDLLADFNQRPPALQASRSLFAIRARYAEDELARAVAQGTSQYVILGAGLDSFAYRSASQLPQLAIFEVDHPSSQLLKRQRVADLAIAVPPSLHYVPVDFETESLGQPLVQAGLNPRSPTFFSCLGVTQYLSRPSVLRLLRGIVETSASGSDLVLQFQVPPQSLGEDGGRALTALAGVAATHGEPFLSFFTPAEMERLLLEAGFSNVEHFGVQQATERYLRHRSDDLRLPAHFHIAKAHLR